MYVYNLELLKERRVLGNYTYNCSIIHSPTQGLIFAHDLTVVGIFFIGTIRMARAKTKVSC